MKRFVLKTNLKIENGSKCPGCGKDWNITEIEPDLLARFKRVMGFDWPVDTKAYGIPLKDDYKRLRLNTEGVPETLSLCLSCCVGYLEELTSELLRIYTNRLISILEAEDELSMLDDRLIELGVNDVSVGHFSVEMQQELTEFGVLQIEAEFHGNGDEAQMDSLEVTEPENMELPTDLATELEGLLPGELPSGYGTDEDSHGSILVDVDRGVVTVAGNWNREEGRLIFP
jgi:hypothetical protein